MRNLYERIFGGGKGGSGHSNSSRGPNLAEGKSPLALSKYAKVLEY